MTFLDLCIIAFLFLYHEIIIVERKNFFLNRRVFIKGMDKCILKMFVFVYVSILKLLSDLL